MMMMMDMDIAQALHTLRDGDADYMQIGRYDVLYNAHAAGGGRWEVYEHDSDHTTYHGYTDIHEAVEILVAQ